MRVIEEKSIATVLMIFEDNIQKLYLKIRIP
jgi:hypothetical protein